MKKLLTVLVTLMLAAVAVTGCTKTPADNSGDVNTGVVTPDNETPETPDEIPEVPETPDEVPEVPEVPETPEVETPNPEQPEQPEVPSPDAIPEVPATPDETPVETPDAPVSGEAIDLNTAELSAIIDALYGKFDIPLMLMTMPIDLTDADRVNYMTGLESADKIADAAASEPMMGSQAYSLVLVRTESAEDAAGIAQSMKDGINPAKWICVEADDLKVGAYNDLVLLFMVDSEFSDVVTAEGMMNAFKELCGGTLSVEL